MWSIVCYAAITDTPSYFQRYLERENNKPGDTDNDIVANVIDLEGIWTDYEDN